MSAENKLTLKEQNERFKDLIIFIREELDELINSIDEEVEITEGE